MPEMQPSNGLTIRRLTGDDWMAYRDLFTEAAQTGRDTFEGMLADVSGRPETYWRNAVQSFTRFGGFSDEGELRGVVGLVILPYKDGTHKGHLFGRCAMRVPQGDVMRDIERHVLDQGTLFRGLYENLNQLMDFNGNQKDFLEWLGIKIDFNNPIPGASPYLLKEG